ncbi:hypothetical protein HAX54_050273, partial [Datura stramonium]|nr:hypothetical protein [Datura stramonium]
DARSINKKLLKRPTATHPNCIDISLPYQRAQLTYGSIPLTAARLDLEIVVEVVRVRNDLINKRLTRG